MSTSAISPTKRSLDEITNLPPAKAIRKESATTTELRALSPELSRLTLERLLNGYSDKSGSGYGPVLTNNIGCKLVQKSPNRDDNGYIQIAPVVELRSRAKKGEEKKRKASPQNAHRLVVMAHKR